MRRRKPRALDLFCCAGGATRGLQEAGFHVTGVDTKPQPHYVGDRFYLGDALDFPIEGFDFVWASPPCQAFTALRFMPTAKEHPNLIPQTRDKLLRAQVPYCIENVEGAPLGDSGHLILLCGTMFGLQTVDGRAELRRHRLFETSFSIALRPACNHGASLARGLWKLAENGHPGKGVCRDSLDRWRLCRGEHQSKSVPHGLRPHAGGQSTSHISVTGTGLGGRISHGRAITVTGSTAQTNTERNRVRETFTVQQAREAMGIDWMPMSKLSQAIPPAYSRFIGREAIKLLRESALPAQAG